MAKILSVLIIVKPGLLANFLRFVFPNLPSEKTFPQQLFARCSFWLGFKLKIDCWLKV